MQLALLRREALLPVVELLEGLGPSFLCKELAPDQLVPCQCGGSCQSEEQSEELCISGIESKINLRRVGTKWRTYTSVRNRMLCLGHIDARVHVKWRGQQWRSMPPCANK